MNSKEKNEKSCIDKVKGKIKSCIDKVKEKIKSFMIKHPRVKIIIIFVLILAIIIGGPYIINEAYLPNTGYMTVWDGSDVLAYFGTIIGAVGTILLGRIAISQTDKSNKMSERLMNLEEERHKLEVRPFVMLSDCKLYTITSLKTLNNVENANIQIDGLDEEAMGIYCFELELINSTNSFLTAEFLSANSTKFQSHTIMLERFRAKQCLKPGEKKSFVLFSSRDSMMSLLDNIPQFCFKLENRFAERYQESFSLSCLTTTNSTSHKLIMIDVYGYKILPQPNTI